MPPIRSRLTPTFGYNVNAARYTNLATGRFVPQSQIRAALDTALQRSQAEMLRVSRELVNGNMSVAEWQVASRRLQVSFRLGMIPATCHLQHATFANYSCATAPD